MIDRDKQIEMLTQAPERTIGYFRKWLENQEVKAALHRYDDNGNEAPRRASAGR